MATALNHKDDPRYRAAVYREYLRRQTTQRQQAPVERPLTARCALDEHGHPVTDCGVSGALNERLAGLQKLPVTALRRSREADLFRDAVLARHWPTATALLRPNWIPEASPAQLAYYKWWHELEADVRPRPLTICCSRGSSKTESGELCVAFAAMEGIRTYGLWVHAVQPKAADSVGNVAEILTGALAKDAFPDTAERYETGVGVERDWRRDRVRTSGGFTIDALGLDQAMRGAKLEQERPDIVIFDDCEMRHDTTFRTNKRMEAITTSIIPALSPTGAVVFAQNMIHEDSMMAQIVDGRADFLANRRLVGPIPQIRGMKFERQDVTDGDPRAWVITGGEPTWERLNIEVSEQQLNDEGPTAFMMERQHVKYVPEDGMFPKTTWAMMDATELPPRFGLGTICRAWDLAATDSDTADWTVGALMCVVGAKRTPVVIHVERFRLEVSETEDRVMAVTEQDRQDYGRHCVSLLEKQPAAAGKAWKRDWDDLMADYRVEYVTPIGAKAERADKLAVRQQKGLVGLVRGNWNARYTDEMAVFNSPGARHDDQVDASAMAFNWLVSGARRKGRVSKAKGVRPVARPRMLDPRV